MTNEKSNNDNWKTSLEDAAALQEYTLQNKSAAWENLYSKLHKKHKPKFLWYWLAAACLIATASIIVFMHQSANDNVRMPVATKKQPQQNTISKEKTQQPAVEKINTKQEVVNIKSSNTHKPIKAHVDKNEIIITGSPVLQHTELSAIKVEPSTIKGSVGAVTTTAVIQPHKKMKIVHVNELDDEGSNLNITQNKEHIPLRVKFFNQDIYTDYTLRNSNSGVTILKRNNSPSN